MLREEIKHFIKTQKLGFIATVCPDGTPNLSPKGTTTVWDDEHLIFLDIYSPVTIQNLVINPAIEINIVDVFTRKGYRFKGRAEILSEGQLFHDIISSYGEGAKKYTVKHVVMVKVERVLPLTSPVYDTGATENEVLEKWTAYWQTIHPILAEQKRMS